MKSKQVKESGSTFVDRERERESKAILLLAVQTGQGKKVLSPWSELFYRYFQKLLAGSELLVLSKQALFTDSLLAIATVSAQKRLFQEPSLVAIAASSSNR